MIIDLYCPLDTCDPQSHGKRTTSRVLHPELLLFLSITSIQIDHSEKHLPKPEPAGTGYLFKEVVLNDYTDKSGNYN
jgi:hypothetical protein